jgi:hypothetical protein
VATHEPKEYSKTGGLLAGLRFQKYHNEEGRNNRNRCGKVDASNDLLNIYHSSKYRSILIAIIVVSIQNTMLYVKLTTVVVKGMAIKHVVAKPVISADATFKLA